MEEKQDNFIYKIITFYKNHRPKRKFVEYAILIHLISFLLILVTDFHFYIKTFLMIISAIIPILLLVTLSLDTKIYRKYEKYKWVSLIKYLIITIYLIIANNYSFTIINETFKIDPTFFPVTSILLTLLFPVHLSGELAQLSYLIISMFLFILLVISIKLGLKTILLTFYFILIFVSNYTLEKRIKEYYLKEVALNYDFNSNHRCQNLEEIDKVIFMNEKVFIFDKKNSKNPFSIQDCLYNQS